MWVETGESSYQVIKKVTTIRESFWHWWWSKEKKKKKWMSETESFGRLSYDSIHIYQFGIKNLTLLIFHISSTCSCFPSKSFCNTVICGLHAMPLYFLFFFTAFICKLLNLNVSHWTHVIIHQKLIFIMQEKKIKIICII